MRIIPIASGKGGVGKSLIAANLAVIFAQSGKRVVLVDLDLGASNLHLVLGYQSPQKGIGLFINGTQENFSDIIVDTEIRGLRFIPGDNEIPGTANLKTAQRKALVKQLLALEKDTDILILDLGAGTHQSILDFFLLSGQGIIITAPMVTAVLNAYIFLKNASYRLMYTIFTRGTRAYEYLEQMRKEGSGPRKLYVPRMIAEIKQVDPPSYAKFKAHFDRFHPRLIMNLIDDPKDADVSMKIRRSCEEYLDLQIEHLGIIYRDSIQDIALSSRLPVVLYKPQSLISQALYRIAEKILQSGEEKFSLTDKEIDDSFQEAGVEAESDFENRMDYVEDLLHSGVLSQGDLVETIKSQQFEITKIKKENNFLKYKLAAAMSQGFKP
ncbi:P-loop NTPase [Treponema sp. TIM-1]|uniref:nucleotide-binding protein n=1 Tax=Treponema sp. TIM-1 TaxID=2898417 RepID=UPI0039804539